jgi:hypothetical protein
MSQSFLESTLLHAVPSFQPDWALLRGAWSREEAPSTVHFLASLRVHVVARLQEGDAVVFTRLAQTLERLLGEADPILEELLVDHLVSPLARETGAGGVRRALVEPHLGRRMRKVWEEQL